MRYMSIFVLTLAFVNAWKVTPGCFAGGGQIAAADGGRVQDIPWKVCTFAAQIQSVFLRPDRLIFHQYLVDSQGVV